LALYSSASFNLAVAACSLFFLSSCLLEISAALFNLYASNLALYSFKNKSAILSMSLAIINPPIIFVIS